MTQAESSNDTHVSKIEKYPLKTSIRGGNRRVIQKVSFGSCASNVEECPLNAMKHLEIAKRNEIARRLQKISPHLRYCAA